MLLLDRPVFPILFSLWLLVFAASAQVIIVSPILPEIEAALGVPEARLGWLITAYATMLGVFSLVAGPVSDRVGRRSILLLGSTAMAATLLLHGLATSFWSLLVMRALSGAAGGILSGAAVAYVGDYFPYERRGWANGWVMSGIAVGQILGIPAGKVLATVAGYQWPFLSFGLVMIVAAGLIWRALPQPPVERAAEPVTFAGAAASYARLVSQRAPRAAMLAFLLMFFCIGLFIPYFPIWLERVVGLGAVDIAWLFGLGGATNMIAGPMAGRLSDRIGRKPLVVASCIVFGVGLLLVPVLVTGFVTAAVFFSFVMLSVALRMSPLQALITALVPDQQRGQMMSAAIACGQVGMAIGAAVAGIVYAQYSMAGNAVAGAVFILLMAVVVVRGLPEPELSPVAQPAV